MDFTAEFIPEAARIYIAKVRRQRKLPPFAPLHLSDDDQYFIMKSQLDAEDLMWESCAGNVLIVSDTSPLNTLLYMSEGERLTPRVRQLVRRALLGRGSAFYCPLFLLPRITPDPNRIHDYGESIKLDESIGSVLARHAPEVKLIRLTGDSEERSSAAVEQILSQLSVDAARPS